MSSAQAATSRPYYPTPSDPKSFLPYAARRPQAAGPGDSTTTYAIRRLQNPGSPRVREYLASVCFLMLEDAEHSVEVYCRIKHLKSKDLLKKPS